MCYTVVNGLSGDADICNVFMEYFQSVYRPNTPDADLQYEKQVQNWLEQKTDCSKCVYCGFLDASNAFDKLLHNGLFLKLLERSISVDFVRLLCNWYSKLTASVTWNNFVGAHFVILCGVRQGGILSPLLFSVYVDYLTQLLKHSGYGTYIGNQFVGTILYAGDITLLSGSYRNLQKMLDICAEFDHKCDICFNANRVRY